MPKQNPRGPLISNPLDQVQRLVECLPILLKKSAMIPEPRVSKVEKLGQDLGLGLGFARNLIQGHDLVVAVPDPPHQNKHHIFRTPPVLEGIRNFMILMKNSAMNLGVSSIGL